MASRNRNGKPAALAVQLDRDAYERLEQARGQGESLSDVIKRCVRQPKRAEDVLRAMRAARVSTSTLRSIEESATRRRKVAHKSKG